MTSHDVVARVRRLAGTRKVGHAGTLDPMATGVLVLGVNRATRLLGHLMLDREGVRRHDPARRRDHHRRRRGRGRRDRVDGRRSTRPPSAAALAALAGDIEQVPTAVSAIKVDGKRAYQRVRAGEEVELPARPVTVHALVVHDGASRRRTSSTSTSRVRCSSGTYVRALARDLGAALGVGGHLTALRRTAVGPVRPRRGPHPRRARRATSRCCRSRTPRARRFPSVDLDDEQAARRPRRPRRSTSRSPRRPGAVFAPDGEFLALYEPRDGAARPGRRLRLSPLGRFPPCRSGARSTTSRPTSAARSWSSATSTASTSATARWSPGRARSPTSADSTAWSR